MSPSVPPSDCQRARESISAQLDGELSELGSARLSVHLRDCPACSAHAQELAAIAAELRVAPLDRPEFEIWLPRRRVTAPLRTAPVRIAAAAAVMVLAASLSFVAGHEVAGGGPGATTAARPLVNTPRADVVEQQVLAMLRDARSRRRSPVGRLIFV
jgi:predicted anti-sigma-YlaC factor YlaD